MSRMMNWNIHVDGLLVSNSEDGTQQDQRLADRVVRVLLATLGNNANLPRTSDNAASETRHTTDVLLYRYETGPRHKSVTTHVDPTPVASADSLHDEATKPDAFDHGLILSTHTRAWTTKQYPRLGLHYIALAASSAFRDCRKSPERRRIARGISLQHPGPCLEMAPDHERESLRTTLESSGAARYFVSATNNNEDTLVAFREGSMGAETLLLGGFYRAEAWGAWSRITDPWIVLPCMLEGTVQLALTCMGVGKNIGRQITINIGGHTEQITLTAAPSKHILSVAPGRPTNIISFSGLIAEKLPDIVDVRTMGIGLIELSVQPLHPLSRSIMRRFIDMLTSLRKTSALRHEGAVYLSFLEPDNRDDNWQDLVTAFCEAFRHQSDKLLVLRTDIPWPRQFLSDFCELLYAVGPKRCRVMLVADLPLSETYRALLSRTHYYVTARKADAACLDVVEALAAGIPVVAPRHTSLADWVTAGNGIVVESSLEPVALPCDPAQHYLAYRHRIDWQSLKEGLEKSACIMEFEPTRYDDMSRAASNLNDALTE